MGLDIISYANVEFLHPATGEIDYDDLYDNNQKYVENQHPYWPWAFEGLTEGIYKVSEPLHFRAGSYSGYNLWRSELARFAGYSPQDAWDNHETYKNFPFFELVCFSDCEGIIGPETCADLAADFITYRDQFHNENADPTDNHWSLRKYDDWMRAFTRSCLKGMVCLR